MYVIMFKNCAQVFLGASLDVCRCSLFLLLAHICRLVRLCSEDYRMDVYDGEEHCGNTCAVSYKMAVAATS